MNSILRCRAWLYRAAGLVALLCGASPGVLRAQAPSFTRVYGGGAWAGGLSGDGSTIVGGMTGPVAGRWVNAGAFQFLLSNGVAMGVSADGSTSVVKLLGQVARWHNTSVQYINPPSGYGLSYNYGTGVSGNGDILLMNPLILGRSRAFHWTTKLGWQSLPCPPEFLGTYAAGMSHSGDVTVGEATITTNRLRAVRWLGTTAIEDLGLPAGFDQGSARGVSGDGQFIVGQVGPPFASGSFPFVWTPETGFTVIPNLPGSTDGWANGVSYDGSVVVGLCSFGIGVSSRAFVWTRADGTRDLFQEFARYGLNTIGVVQASDLLYVSYDGREFAGSCGGCVWYARLPQGFACFANCDLSTTPPYLSVADFSCFLNFFIAGNTDANCDQSTAPPVLNVNDFFCFLNRFAAGCP